MILTSMSPFLTMAAGGGKGYSIGMVAVLVPLLVWLAFCLYGVRGRFAAPARVTDLEARARFKLIRSEC